MPATLSQVEDDILGAVRTFLLSVLPDGAEVVRGQDNRVSEPGAANYIVMTPMDRLRLATNVEIWDRTDPNPQTIAARHSTEFRVQLDIHGSAGSDWAQIIATTMQGDYAFAQMPDGVKPLYATDGHQIPFVSGENQYEDRWTVTLSLQIAPIVSTAMQFAATLDPTLILVTGDN